MNKLYSETSIQNIANAIRSQLGSEETFRVGEMASAILSISGGGGSSAEDNSLLVVEITPTDNMSCVNGATEAKVKTIELCACPNGYMPTFCYVMSSVPSGTETLNVITTGFGLGSAIIEGVVENNSANVTGFFRMTYKTDGSITNRLSYANSTWAMPETVRVEDGKITFCVPYTTGVLLSGITYTFLIALTKAESEEE